MRTIQAALFASALWGSAAAMAQSGMLVDYAADQMVTKFQTSSCDELKADKEKPKTDEEKAKAQSAKAFLQNDAQARAAFVSKVAAPVLNKMFECGMLP
jgi:hypothetical protein